jgi:hypothetical protein
MFRFNLERLVIPPGSFSAGTCAHHHPKSDVVVPVVRVVPVAIGTPHVPVVIVERPAPQHTVPVSLPPQRQSGEDFGCLMIW